jgi:hypothetical protein
MVVVTEHGYEAVFLRQDTNYLKGLPGAISPVKKVPEIHEDFGCTK